MNSWHDFSYSASDGLMLSGRKYGWEHTTRVPVVCLAGVFTNSSEFHELAEHLSSCENPRRVLTLDYRGRGESDYDKDYESYNILQEAEDAIQGGTAAGLGHINVVASSRGGLVAMLLATMRPGIVNSIVLNDIGPKIEGAGFMRIKRNMENTHDHPNWASAVQFLKQIGQSHFTGLSDEYWDQYARKVFKSQEGKITRNYDPKLLKTLSAIDLETRLPEMWEQFTGISKMPTLLVHGEKSDFLSQKTIDSMKEIHSDMKLIEVPNQGHPPDLSTQKLPEEIERFIALQDHA